MDVIRIRVASCLVCSHVHGRDSITSIYLDAKCHASLLSSFLLRNSLYCGVNEINSFQKLVGNIDKMTVATLGRQHQRSLAS